MSQSNDIRKSIQTANDKFMAAFKRGDAAGLAALYTKDGQVLPPNAEFVSGQQAYPEGYEQLDISTIVDVHIKDAVLRDADAGWTEWTCVGQGEVDYASQLAALRRDGYAGPLTIETHWHPREYATRQTHRGLLHAIERAAIERAALEDAAHDEAVARYGSTG